MMNFDINLSLMKTLILFLALLYSSFFMSQKAHKVNVIHLKQYEEDTKQSIYFADYDASRRGSLIIHNFEDSKSPIKILSEPPPDAIIAFTSAIKNSFELNGQFNTSQSLQFTQAISELTKRNTTIVILRDALYRLNEFNFNNPNLLSKEEYIKEFEKILELVEKISNVELIEKKNELLENQNKNIILNKGIGFYTEVPIYIQYTNKELKDFSDNIINELDKMGYNADGPEYVDLPISNNLVKYFNSEDSDKAESIKKDLESLGIKDVQTVKNSNPKKLKNRFEIWLKSK